MFSNERKWDDQDLIDESSPSRNPQKKLFLPLSTFRHSEARFVPSSLAMRYQCSTEYEIGQCREL